MNCKDWEERLALYAGGDLTKDEALQLERHLGECPGCQMFSSGMKESQDLLRELHREPLAPAHFAAVRARVLAELERGRQPLWLRRWVFTVAAVAALVALAVLPPVRSLLAPKPSPMPQQVALTHSPDARNAGGLAAGVVVPPAPLVTVRVPPRTAPHRASAHGKPRPSEQVMIRMVSDNPDVVIYWIANSRGE